MKRILSYGRQRVTKLLHFALCIYFIIFTSACGEAIYSSSDTGSIAFSVELQGASNEISGPSQAIDCESSGISTVEAKVYDEDGSLLASGGPWNCGAHSGTITGVPAGSNRKVVILGKDASGSVVYSGAKAGIMVTAGQTTNAGEITLIVQDQVWYTSDNFPSNFISEKWALNYDITSLAYGNSMWAVVMSQGTVYTDQVWNTSDGFPSDFISEEWALNYDITSLAYGDGMWAVVMSQGTGYTDQVWNTSDDFPSDFISEKWPLGYEITSLAYGDGMWAVVMSGVDYSQWWATRTDFSAIEDYIYEKWDEGYRITELVYGAKSGVNVWAVYGQLL
jgi:hypothetical protein